MKSYFALFFIILSTSCFADCETDEFNRVRLAANSSKVCLAKYLGSAMSRGMGEWSPQAVVFIQDQLLNLIPMEEDFSTLTLSKKVSFAKAACTRFTSIDFPKYLCQDAAESMIRPVVVEAIYCNKEQNIQDGLCR